MLNTRNVVAAVVIVTVVSLVAACLALFQTPGGGGLGVDSYGTRGHGFRGLFEMLAELHVPIERATVPPSRLLSRDITLALFDPNAEIVSTEPAYLNAVGKWIREGGSVVAAPSTKPRQMFGLKFPTKNLLFELGLEDVHVRQLGTIAGSPDNHDEDEEVDTVVHRNRPNMRVETKRAARNFKRLFGPQTSPRASIVHATAEGSLASRFPHGLDLMLPDAGRCFLESDSEAGKNVPEGRIRAVMEPDGSPETLAAVYAVGSGTITVLADPRLAQNQLVGRADNPVLIAHLLADLKKPIVFDEFYHGLTVRANPLWLLSRFPYDILAASVLAATLLFGWRAARFLGPPLASRPVSRRTLSEYIEAMARLLNGSQSPVPFLLAELRHGLLWRIRYDLGLPPGQDDADRLVQTLRRRDPVLAEQVRIAIRAIDDSLAHPNQPAKNLEQTFAKASLCVPRHAF
jgi:hypothetical protein